MATRNGSLHEVGVKELKVCAARTLAIQDDDIVVDMDTLGTGWWPLLFSFGVFPGTFCEKLQYLIFCIQTFSLK